MSRLSNSEQAQFSRLLIKSNIRTDCLTERKYLSEQCSSIVDSMINTYRRYTSEFRWVPGETPMSDFSHLLVAEVRTQLRGCQVRQIMHVSK